MGKKIKFYTACLCLLPLVSFTSCASINKETELSSIQLVSDINDLKLEINETYVSNTIEVKCYDTNYHETQCKTSLNLYSLTNDNIDISIKNNQIHIGTNKKEGNYKYRLVAINEDGTITSNYKDINIFVYKNKPIPDSIELIGVNEQSFMGPSDQTIDYQLIGKLDGKIIDDFDTKCNIEISVKSDSGLDKDLFNNPLFTIVQNNEKFLIKVSKNIDRNYEGKYELDIKINLISNPRVFSRKTINFNLIYGLESLDKKTNFFYSRQTINSDWYLSSAPADTTYLSESNILPEIYGNKVIGINDNFCQSSGIKKMVSVKLPKNITIIGKHAFEGQESLSSIELDNIEYIDDYAFNNCPILVSKTDASWPATFIGNYAFNNDYKMTNKTFNNALSIGERAFYQINASSLTFGNNLLAIGAEAFYDCQNLTNIYLWAKQPPVLLGDIIGGSTPSNCKIHVPSSAVQNYQNTPNWQIYAQNLIGDLN